MMLFRVIQLLKRLCSIIVAISGYPNICITHQAMELYQAVFRKLSLTIPVSILHKSIAGRSRPIRVADGPITARCRFM